MTGAILTGALVGAGLFLLLRALFPARRGLRSLMAEYDEVTKHGGAAAKAAKAADTPRPSLTERLQKEVGEALAKIIEDRGWELRSTRADLAILDRDYQTYLASKVLAPAVALAFTPLFVALLALTGGVSLMIPVWGGLLFALAAFFFPDLQLRQEAGEAREDFRHVVGAFLDLVSMNLAGGRGVPEALMTASQIGAGAPMLAIREALANARIVGQTPWQALGALGERIAVAELADLASALALVADDGAKIRQSLSARAASMRSREISALEGRAGQNSQTMLIAQLSFCLGFLVFLLYPSAMQVISF
ncbi:Flp pilus assembly protein TadB [Actinocorallia herbida]|uniref:Flp pilus assembly protein TadB n=1 Tax=Actinocorallia herbida TaxID=58109 RepID=A0A3N1D994_9ACTN|nr:type II secretion system protein [Actinocorallia herbida]ROO90100.1 Flp pilus assembly protein TadB [Actinocorallia herbida]